MYRFKLADKEDMVEISKIKKFDLNLEDNPRFYLMEKNDEILTFVLIINLRGNNYIDFIYFNNLNINEIDFFFRSLVYALGSNIDLYTKYKYEPYTIGYNEEWYKVVIPKGSSCGD